MHSQFYIGIVENRKDDPLKLGRCQVRIFGVHTENKVDIPTKDLPWAIPVMPNIGTALSGMGHSPSFLVEGTTVLIFFQDAESKQEPMILGSLHGVPLDLSPFGKKSNITEELFVVQEGTRMVSAGSNGVTETPMMEAPANTPMVTGDTRTALKAALGQKESSNNYKAVNQFNFLGKYQFGAAMLTDLGYVKKGTRNAGLNDPANWTGKGGATSKEAFLNSPEVQERAIDEELDLNTKRLKKLGVIDENSKPEEVSGYLATAHLLGTGGARDMKNGISKKDGNGVTGETYYNLGYKSAAGTNPIVGPAAATADNPYNVPAREQEARSEEVRSSGMLGTDTRSTTVDLGFSDPEKKYPKKDHLKEQDTNRLARNQNVQKTIVPIKEEVRDLGVLMANRKGTWDQSPIPYNAKYPFNHVLETESGHILEHDDTPANERLHEWHRTGTFREIDRNGTEVHRIVGDSYEILERNGFVHVKGTVTITVEGDARVLVANDLDLQVDGDMNATVGGNLSWAVGGSIKVKSGGVEHHTNGGIFAVDAPAVYFNSGRSTAGSVPGPYRSRQGVPQFEELTLEARAFEELSEFETDDLTPEQAAARQEVLAEAGLIDANPPPPQEMSKEEVPANTTEAIPVACGMFTPGNIQSSAQLSPNFKVSSIARSTTVKDQAGLKDTDIACNMKALAENILEGVRSKYPNMIITSGLRTPGSNPNSQHPKGEAIDLQFSGVKSSEYINIARDLASFLPYDQLILEYRTNKRNGAGEPTTWIHISHSRQSNRKQLFTMNNDLRVSDFGVLKLIT